MKLRINGFENELEFDDEHVNLLTIKNAKCFSHILEILNQKVNGLENEEIYFLDEQNEEIKFNKTMIIFDIFNIEYNSKKILNKIYEIISQNVENSQELEIENMIVELRKKIIQEINELPFEFEMKDDIDITEILKLYSLKIDTTNYETVLERIEFIIDLVATLKLADIIIIPNLKMYLTEEETIELYKYSLYNNIKLLIIERKNEKHLKYENEMQIDENYCDRIIK